MVEQDDAVGDVLLQAVAREGAVATLGGDDRRDAPVLEPTEQSAQLGAEDGGVRYAAEEVSAWRETRSRRWVWVGAGG